MAIIPLGPLMIPLTCSVAICSPAIPGGRRSGTPPALAVWLPKIGAKGSRRAAVFGSASALAAAFLSPPASVPDASFAEAVTGLAGVAVAVVLACAAGTGLGCGVAAGLTCATAA